MTVPYNLVAAITDIEVAASLSLCNSLYTQSDGDAIYKVRLFATAGSDRAILRVHFAINVWLDWPESIEEGVKTPARTRDEDNVGWDT